MIKMINNRALLFIDINEKNDRDVFHATNYSDFCQGYRLSPSNSGNKLWLDAIEQYILQDQVQYDHLIPKMLPEVINEQYDYILFPAANLINIMDKEKLVELACFFKKIKIPIYIVGLGAQVKNNNEIDSLIKNISYEAKLFLDSVYSTGGDIGLRGEITKEIIFKLGFDQPKVIGCPSIYVNGRNFGVYLSDKLERESFKLLLNGDTEFLSTRYVSDIIKQFKNSIYIDQETFLPYLYDSNMICGSIKEYSRLVSNISKTGVKLLCQDRVKLFFDIPIWKEFIASERFSMCFGSRIHGSIIAILCGIPAYIVYKDLRVKEMAEYYNIPSTSFKNINGKKLLSIYEELDYSQFNKEFCHKFDKFKEFFDLNGIANSIGDNSKYLDLIKNIKYDYPPRLNCRLRENIISCMDRNSLMTKVAQIVGQFVFSLKHQRS